MHMYIHTLHTMPHIQINGVLSFDFAFEVFWGYFMYFRIKFNEQNSKY